MEVKCLISRFSELREESDQFLSCLASPKSSIPLTRVCRERMSKENSESAKKTLLKCLN
jgi:hypothetical protein